MARVLISLLSLFAVISAHAGVKNVLYIISDDLKASVLSCYGNSVCATPNIDRLATYIRSSLMG